MENPKEKFEYGSCMRNYAAKLGGHATDGCQEFVPAGDDSRCVACGCHLSFHNKMAVVDNTCGGGGGNEESSNNAVKVKAEVIEVSDDEAEKEKENQLLALLEVAEQQPQQQWQQQQHHGVVVEQMGSSRRRARTRFTDEQRQQMFAFSNSLGWRMRRERWDETNRFCEQIGVSRQVFKAWLNNNKPR
ncbi:zinc-finger homeodomain protein 1-like [Telopea speciosissima]|uniref:zinc-finger homeodomain protein 1-like n=1 Tax=Telopea speciosissima TaxID=54955 RepID=UPI001CC4751A|nr:zinc-finger homeodomain protein 1-like [Telopea speciosissima]